MKLAGWEKRRVLITGHTGFKGSWLAYWLRQLGADVCGYALAPSSQPSHWSLVKPDVHSVIGDIRDREKLEGAFRDFQPDIVFHLAAQPLVRASYRDPVETYSTNVMGSLHVFEACRKTGSVRAVINVTSDKCYENREWPWGYRECDRMGGYDPYSSSKGCSELLTASYRNSYFNTSDYGATHQTLLASCRSGNVIGGGDWSADRLVSDLVRAAEAGSPAEIRCPSATRPWQHVLEPLGGYLLVGQHLLAGRTEAACGWNFGPAMHNTLTVREVVERMQRIWPAITADFGQEPDLHEAQSLTLDISKGRRLLGWQPVWDVQSCLERTAHWYRDYCEEGVVRTADDLDDYQRAVAALSDHRGEG